jgi:hypothetical protein
MAGQATIVANGIDDVLDLWNNPWGTELDARVAPLLQQAGYQVLSNEIDTSIDFWRLIGNTYPYQIRLRLDTGALPNTVPALTKSVHDALTQATGYAPTAIAVTSGGQQAPAAPEGPIDRVVDGAGDLAETIVGGTQLITIALALGVVALIYFAVKNPKQARALI